MQKACLPSAGLIFPFFSASFFLPFSLKKMQEALIS
ncbi:hypothetical protein LBUL_1499 [Lactobacillus delbrueckii subsp. bulgaricus ATCC BAA-365]|nr:hypothetical protein LBUL_1499 [Lactobacillus delbrueckii subsp. bulgaricus ATCC BAA-365]